MTFHPQPLFFLVLGLVAGTLAPLAEVSVLLVTSLGLAAVLSILAVARPRLVPLAALMVAAAAAGACLASSARVEYEKRALPQAIGDAAGSVILVGRVASDPRVVDDETRFDVESTAIIARGVERRYGGRIRLFLKSSGGGARVGDPIGKGDAIRAWVELRSPEPVRTPGGFDQLEWAMREGLHGFASCKNERLLEVVTKRMTRRTPIDWARDSLKASWRHVEDPQNRAVTASMVLGDDGALDAATRDEFRSSGLLHLLVVSGSQVAALILGLRRVMPQALRISWPGCLLECGVLISYCLIAGAGDSIVRATVMAVTFAIAVRVDLHRGGANFLAAAALALLATRPLDAADPGAQMSFAATLGLVTFAVPAARKLEEWGAPGLLADVVAATLVASAVVAPIALVHFHRFSLIALPANLIAAPLAVALLYASLLTACLDSFFGGGAAIAGALCGFIAEALRSIAAHAAALDPDWRGPAPPLVVMAGLAGFIAASGWRRRALGTAGILAGLAMSGRPLGDGRVHLWFLDVGQGDAVLIETPNGQAAVIDAGPAFDRFDAGERIVGEALWKLGHRRLAFLGVTHRHVDHEGGAAFLARHFDPGRIYVNGPSLPLRDFHPSIVQRGGEWSIDGVSFRVLGPDPQWPLSARDENAHSLVIEVRYGQTLFLLLGDAGALTEGLLDLPGRSYDIVKVGHHGASTSSSERLVRQTRPRIAVVSVGSRNRFSHPSPDVVDRWTRAGARVWRTDLNRTLHAVSDGARVTW